MVGYIPVLAKCGMEIQDISKFLEMQGFFVILNKYIMANLI